MSEESDPKVDELISQLQDMSVVNDDEATNQAEQSQDNQPLSPEELEAFVIQNSSQLVNRSLNAIDQIKDVITASGDPDSISALSELIRASSGALEGLNKLVVQNKRTDTTLTAKKMDAQAKYAIEEKKNENALLASRDEMFKLLMKNANAIDVTNDKINRHSQNQKK